jgi:O-antigen/teichoic acid export membrane protein
MFKKIFSTALKSPTILNWINQFSVFFHGIFITSLILVKFPNLEYSFWMLLKTMTYFGLLAESGLGYTIERAASTFYAGSTRIPANAKEYKAFKPEKGSPNYYGLRDLLYTTKFVYSFLSFFTILLLSVVGIAIMWNLFVQSQQNMEFWVAYAFMILQTMISLQTIKWRSLMTGTQNLVPLYRFNTALVIIRIFGYLAILLSNLGIAYLMAYSLCEQIVTYLYIRGFVVRWFHRCNVTLTNSFRMSKEIFHSLWSVSWKSGLNTWGYFFTSKGIELMVSQVKDSRLMASYLFTNSILGFIKNIAQSPVTVQYPYFYKLMAGKDFKLMKTESSRRIFLANFLVISGIVAFGLLGNQFLDIIHATDKSIVPASIYIIISLFLFFELNSLFHGTFYLTTNDVPFLVPSIITGVLMVTTGMLILPRYGLLGLVSVQLILNLACNFWYSTHLSLRLLNWPFSRYIQDVVFIAPKYWIHRISMILKTI